MQDAAKNGKLKMALSFPDPVDGGGTTDTGNLAGFFFKLVVFSRLQTGLTF